MHMMQPVEAPAQTSHNPFDICDCQDCLDEAYKLEYEEEDNQRKKKGSQFTLKQRYEAGDPTVGLLGEPSGKFDYYVLYGDSKPKPKPPKPSPPPPLKHPPTPPKECFTLTPAPSPQNYHTEFPPLSTFENVQQKARHSWKIENPTTIGANGVQHQVTPAEATLNWQSISLRFADRFAVANLSSEPHRFAGHIQRRDFHEHTKLALVSQTNSHENQHEEEEYDWSENNDVVSIQEIEKKDKEISNLSEIIAKQDETIAQLKSEMEKLMSEKEIKKDENSSYITI
ncbi:hypothetical protein QVD17_19601 [Tagetes erecta]|uniref:Uncharacterized protein n=1 Tax=Tagetes erecta TaxID=13708 RepID=A0AAD8NXG3_TARER|nr:hypothetical protein QVD17_19601 [Tagetes erecta]